MPTNLYGPGDNYHPTHSHVLPALIRRFHEAAQASVVLSAEDDQRLQRLDAANAPSLNDLLLQMPQDDEGFEGMPLTPREFPCSS
jgi:nucleoside-diphosphate-sugar epimerase